MKNQRVDFCAIDIEHRAVCEELDNWARWARPSRLKQRVAPMFEMYKPRIPPGADGSSEAVVAIPIDILAAEEMERKIVSLPRLHIVAVKWFWITRCSPSKICREHRISPESLNALLVSAKERLRKM